MTHIPVFFLIFLFDYFWIKGEERKRDVRKEKEKEREKKRKKKKRKQRKTHSVNSTRSF